MYEGKNVILRELRESDFEDIMAYVNDYDTYAPFTDSPPRPKTYAQQKEWFDHANRIDMITMAIQAKDSGEFLGTIQLRDLEMALSKSLFSIILKANSHGHGYGAQALRLFLTFAFEELHLNRIMLLVFDSNLPARGLYEKVGFKKEGTLKDHLYRQGHYEDAHVFSILAEDWEEMSS